MMRLKPDINIPEFLQAVHTCAGEVYFVTPEGDNLNLKSTLTRFIFASVIAQKLQQLDGRITVQGPQDEELLSAYCEK